MSEQTDGKRVVPPKSGGSRKWLIVFNAVLAVILCAYIALCAYASRGLMWPNTTVMGTDVSGMTVSQAETAVREGLARRWAGRSVTLRESISGMELSLPMEGLMEPEELPETLTRMAYGKPFFARGARYLIGLAKLDREKLAPGLEYTQEGQERMDGALKELKKALEVDKKDTTYAIVGDEVIFRRGVTGVRLDEGALQNGLYDALTGAGSEEVMVGLERTSYAEPDFDEIYDKVFTTASAAYLDRESGEIVPSVTGRELHIAAAQATLETAEEGLLCPVALKLTIPSPTTEELNGLLFRDVLGEATTRVTGTADRHMNVGVAAEFLNGHVVFPGEEFSFNQICSPYTVENGYGKATAYVNGLSKDTVAGGICQASSTLYWATLRANLETVERSAHRYEPVYIRGGLDATVYGDYGDEGGLDFRFKNTSEQPIKLEAYVDKKNNLHVLIHGTDTTGIHGEPYSTNRVITQAYKTIYEAKDSIPQGTTKKDPERTGYNGVTLETYQKLIDAEGKVVEEKLLYKTKYYVRNEVVFFNPADIWSLNIDPVTGEKLDVPPPNLEVPAEENPEEAGNIPAASEAPVETPPPVASYAPGLLIPPAGYDPDEPMLPPGL